MKQLINGIFLITLFISNLIFADSPAIPESFVTTHPFCSCYFTIIPAKEVFDGKAETRTITPAFGKAYRLNDDGSSTFMWEVSGWYSFENYLSWDGRHLVRIGDWPSGKRPSKDHLAVAFYDNGVELKSYSTADLIKNPRKVQRTISHYFWQAEDTQYPTVGYKNKFYLKTIDGYLYIFDMETGEIVELNKAKK